MAETFNFCQKSISIPRYKAREMIHLDQIQEFDFDFSTGTLNVRAE